MQPECALRAQRHSHAGGSRIGQRTLTLNPLQVDPVAKGWQGLPAQDGKSGQPRAASEAAAPSVELSPGLTLTVDELFNVMRPQNRGRAGSSLVWPSSPTLQAAQGLSVTRAQACNRALIDTFLAATASFIGRSLLPRRTGLARIALVRAAS
jgi:hypothetical protein